MKAIVEPMTSLVSYPGRLTERVRLAVLFLIISGLVVASYAIGINRGMDHKIGWGPLNEMYHLTNAISDTVYGLNHGYVGFGRVFESLKNSLGLKKPPPPRSNRDTDPPGQGWLERHDPQSRFDP